MKRCCASPGRVLWRTNEWFLAIRYAFCPDEQAWQRERKRVLRACHVDIGEYPSTSGMTTAWKEDADPHALVTVSTRWDQKPAHLAATFAHEAWHVASQLFEAMSAKDPGEEIQARVLDGIVRELYADWQATRGRSAPLDGRP